jgi:uncharacterized protein YjbJ (UPF0337 family)
MLLALHAHVACMAIVDGVPLAGPTREWQMETTKTAGMLGEAAGNVKETIGSVAGDVGMQLKGKAGELRGKAQQICADTTDLARDAMSSSPFAVLAGAAAIGFVLGALWASNRD